MFIENRVRKAMIWCIWAIVPIAAVFCIVSGKESGIDVFFILIFVIISMVTQLIGSMALFGRYKELAGFNTMTEEQMKQYEEQHNVKKVSSFIGISFSLIAYVAFLLPLITRELFGLTTSIVFSAITLLALLIFASLYVGVSKRFETK